MARDSFYSEASVSPYKRDGKQVGWKGTLHYHDMGELDAFGKPKRKTTSKTTLTKGKRAATAELKQWREDMEEEARGLGRIPERKKSGEPTVSEVVGNYLAYQLSVNEIEKPTFANQTISLNNYTTLYIGSYIFREVDAVAQPLFQIAGSYDLMPAYDEGNVNISYGSANDGGYIERTLAEWVKLAEAEHHNNMLTIDSSKSKAETTIRDRIAELSFRELRKFEAGYNRPYKASDYCGGWEGPLSALEGHAGSRRTILPRPLA